jgi:membrane protein
VPSLVILMIFLFSRLLGAATLDNKITLFEKLHLQPSIAELLHYLVNSVKGAGWEKAPLGILTVIMLSVGANKFGGQLKDSLDTECGRRTTRIGVRDLLQEKAWALSLSLMFSVSAFVLVGLRALLGPDLPAAVDLLISCPVYGALAAALYKFIPARRIGWRHALPGGALTGLLLGLGREVVQYLLNDVVAASETSRSGAVGGILVFLLWIYYYAQIFLFGAEFTFTLHSRERHEKRRLASFIPPPSRTPYPGTPDPRP